jgi:hypothetical protein
LRLYRLQKMPLRWRMEGKCFKGSSRSTQSTDEQHQLVVGCLAVWRDISPEMESFNAEDRTTLSRAGLVTMLTVCTTLRTT